MKFTCKIDGEGAIQLCSAVDVIEERVSFLRISFQKNYLAAILPLFLLNRNS